MLSATARPPVTPRRRVTLVQLVIIATPLPTVLVPLRKIAVPAIVVRAAPALHRLAPQQYRLVSLVVAGKVFISPAVTASPAVTLTIIVRVVKDITSVPVGIVILEPILRMKLIKTNVLPAPIVRLECRLIARPVIMAAVTV